jgi:hypothetical protein
MATYDQLFGADAPAVPTGMVVIFRRFLQDLRERNRLLGGVEGLSDEELEMCLKLSLDDWNTTPPPSGHTLENHPAFILLLHGAAIQAHKLFGQVQTANQLTYTDGGINVAESDKTALNQSWLQLFSAEYETKKRQFLTAANLEQAYGRTYSEYRALAD